MQEAHLAGALCGQVARDISAGNGGKGGGRGGGVPMATIRCEGKCEAASAMVMRPQWFHRAQALQQCSASTTGLPTCVNVYLRWQVTLISERLSASFLNPSTSSVDP